MEVRVGVNLVFLGERSGGVGRYASELLAALARRDDLDVHAFTSRDEPPALRALAPRARFTQLPVRTSGPPVHLGASFGAIPVLAAKRRLDVVHSPANAGPVRAPGPRWVTTLHDALWLQAGEDWDSPKAIARQDRMVRATAPRADRLITGSLDTREQLVALLGLDVTRIDVVPHGVSLPASAPTPEAELRARLGLGDRRVVLCVAQKRRYKNQETLIAALPELPADVALVLPGAPTPYEERLRELAAPHGHRVVFPDWITDADLEGLYALASCCALPSRLEGFGLPALEAMARGVPVVASDRSALPEAVGDAGLLADPDDPSAFAAMMRRVLDDPQLAADLVTRGRRRAAEFTWDRTAELTVAAYRRALERA